MTVFCFHATIDTVFIGVLVGVYDRWIMGNKYMNRQISKCMYR